MATSENIVAPIQANLRLCFDEAMKVRPGCARGARALETRWLSTTVADTRFARPLDVDLILRLAREREILVMIEEGSMGGFANAVLHTLLVNDALDRGLKLRVMALPDAFTGQDKPDRIYARAGLNAAGIVAAASEALDKSAPARFALRQCGKLSEGAWTTANKGEPIIPLASRTAHRLRSSRGPAASSVRRSPRRCEGTAGTESSPS